MKYARPRDQEAKQLFRVMAIIMLLKIVSPTPRMGATIQARRLFSLNGHTQAKTLGTDACRHTELIDVSI
ncbi:MAG: hypothetical protein WAM77_13005 [Xanthobacteraceae bacterium]